MRREESLRGRVTSPNPGHNLASSELLPERAIAKDGEPCSTESEQSRIEETHATQVKIPTDPVYYTKEIILVRESKWNDIPACQSFNGDSLHGILIKMKENLTALFIGILWVQNCGKQFRSQEDELSRIRIGFDTSMKEVTRWGSSIASVLKHSLLYIRASQGRTGGNMIAPDLMGHVGIPYTWKELLFHRKSLRSLTQDSLLEDEKVKKEDGQSSSHLSTLLVRIQMKKNLATIYQNRENYSVTASGKLLRTPSIGLI